MSPGYRALREGAAWFDVSDRARLRLAGADRIRLLHALASAVVEGVEPEGSVETFFLTPQGRIVARCRLHVEAESVLAETDAASRQPLLDYLDSYIIMDDVTVTDETDSSAAIEIAGPSAAPISLPSPWYPGGPAGTEGRFAVVDPADVAALVSELESAGCVPAAEGDRLAVRVENGAPEFGVDYGPKNLPHETQLLDLVSFSKGCYVGQEIVERVNTQGQVNRLLCRLEVDADKVPDERTLLAGGQPTGEITSMVVSPREDCVLGFALLRREMIARAEHLTLGGYAVRIRPWP